MKMNLPKRYVTEAQVKKALRIKSFRNLSKDKVMKFASMIPYMDREVAIAIINQFPRFADFGESAISIYTQMCNNILENCKEGHVSAVNAYQTILDTLAKRMEVDGITEEERKSITEDMINVADKIAELNLQYQKFLDRMSNKILVGVCFIAAAVGAAIGVKSFVGNAGELPEVASDDEDEDDTTI